MSGKPPISRKKNPQPQGFTLHLEERNEIGKKVFIILSIYVNRNVEYLFFKVWKKIYGGKMTKIEPMGD